jgi:hypothetical protein
MFQNTAYFFCEHNLAEEAALKVCVICPLMLPPGVGIPKFALTIAVGFLVVVLSDQKSKYPLHSVDTQAPQTFESWPCPGKFITGV